MQALFKKGKNLFAWDISMLKPLETHLLKKADPTLKSKPYQRIRFITAEALAEERKLALPIVCKQSLGLGIRADPSTKNHSCQSRRLFKTSLDIAQDDPEVRKMLGEMTKAISIADPRERLEAFATTVGISKTWQGPLSEMYHRFAEDLPKLSTSGAPNLPSRQLAEQIAAADIPSLVISGGHRQAFENLCDILAGILGAQRAVFPGYGHVPQASGEPFNTCLEHFWSQRSS